MNSRTFDAFGTEVSCISSGQLAQQIESWARAADRVGHVVCFSDTHGIVQGHDSAPMRHALATADIVVPDGHPVAWLGRVLHAMPARRTCGPDFFDLLSSRSPGTGLKHYLYGGKPGVAAELAAILVTRYPGIRIVGVDSPPMGRSSPAATEEQLARITAAAPDVVWVGLGAPKQEIWMAQHRHRLAGITLCGVGAAFDFHTGRVRRAPSWMSRNGLEWAYRWYSEPQRLGPRYRKTIARFFVLLLGQVWRMAWAGALPPKAKQAARRA